MKKLTVLVALAAAIVACGKSDVPGLKKDEAPIGKQDQSAQPSAAPSAPVATAETWAEPATLCVHTVAVCDENEKCRTQKAKLNAAGIRAYQLFDVECVKWVTKRQTVLGASYPACAACLRDATAPQAVQDCMFTGGPCHGDAPK